MAFPTDLEIEVAFNNDFSETDYAQSGWTSILPFVSSFSGDLRGREYELDRTEAGTVSVTLDNSDGRFLPGSVQSPYYPFVKANRRFRIRGKNMLHPNVARAGSRDHDMTGFINPDEHAELLTAPFTTSAKAQDAVRIITASASTAGFEKEKANDGLASTMWKVSSGTGWLQYQLAVPVQITRYSLQIPAGNPNDNPDNWTLQGSNNGSSWTTIHTVTGNTWAEDYEIQEFTVTSPGFYLYYKLDITSNVGNTSTLQLTEWDINYDDAATDLQLLNQDLTHYIDITMAPADVYQLNTWLRTVSWFVPLEYGVRLSHSAHIWRIDGTEPTGMKAKFHVDYFDGNWNQVNPTERVGYEWVAPTSSTPTQIGFSHTPPASAKYGVASISFYYPSVPGASLTYAISGMQSELPANLAPDVSGYLDTFNWQMESEADTPGTVSHVTTSGGAGTLTEQSSPAYVSGNTATVTTASFTPANNSLLIAMCSQGNGLNATIGLGTVTDSLGGTWTRVASDGPGAVPTGSVSEIWIRDVVTGAAMTVTYNPGGSAASGTSLKVQVVTGARTVANQKGLTYSNQGQFAYESYATTSVNNSRIYGAFSNSDSVDPLVANANTTSYGSIVGSGGDTAGAFRNTGAVIPVPADIILGYSNNPNFTENRICMWECQAASVGDPDPTIAYLSVSWQPEDTNVFVSIPHLIPGEWYTATVEAKLVGVQPNVLFSGDEGETGALVNSTTFTQYTTTFQAQQPEQEVRFILQGTPTAGEGLQIRKLRVEHGENLSLSLPTTGTEAGYTTWARPKDIFEGWIERWPAIAGSLDMTVSAVDRLKRLGDIELANTLREAYLKDFPALVLPMTDSMLDTPGRFSQIGYWGDVDGGPTYVDISKTRGDIGTSTYTTQTDDGPTGEASLKLTPQSTSVGYLLAIPYSKDFDTPGGGGTGSGGPKPPPAQPKPTESTKYTYTKKWYATWSRSYEGDNSTRFDDSDYMYQGIAPGASLGNQKSLAGFDYKNIMATLKGAEILECTVTVKNDHARWNKGLYVFVGLHGHTTKPGTWVGSGITERKWKKWVTEGGSATIDMGAGAGRGLRDGVWKGISIGPESDTDNYGYFRGAKQSGRPFITIKYRK